MYMRTNSNRIQTVLIPRGDSGIKSTACPSGRCMKFSRFSRTKSRELLIFFSHFPARNKCFKRGCDVVFMHYFLFIRFSHQKVILDEKKSDLQTQAGCYIFAVLVLNELVRLAKVGYAQLTSHPQCSQARDEEHRGKTSTHAPGWAFPVSFSVTLSGQSLPRASFCVRLVVQLFCFMLLVFLTIL